ncbi:hypothetical protein KM043_012995 [Ampulex compressa]|nr:hypothetical protein KM043_012995 [Ampulex compressa]
MSPSVYFLEDRSHEEVKTNLTKMFRDNATFLILAIFLLFYCDTTSSECTQLTACSCAFPDGRRVDITKIGDSGILNATNKNYNIHFIPCANGRIMSGPNDTECSTGKGTSLCAYNTNEKKFFNLGTIEESKMHLESPNSENVVLTFQRVNRTATIVLICNPPSKTHILLDSANNTNYRLILESPMACKSYPHTKGLSTGSILVILCFVFSGIYFVGGALVLKFLRGATGWEMLPNHTFWCELPSLVRDGIVFTFNCCRADSYERI